MGLFTGSDEESKQEEIALLHKQLKQQETRLTSAVLPIRLTAYNGKLVVALEVISGKWINVLVVDAQCIHGHPINPIDHICETASIERKL